MFAPGEAPRMAFAHMGIYVCDLSAMVDFYSRVLGFCVTDTATIRGAGVAFLSRNPQEHHQIVLVPGRDMAHPSTVNQISFRVVALAELRRIHARLQGEHVRGVDPTNHGGSWSVYFLDPEGNRIELFTPTPWYVPPISRPLDLKLSDEQIYELTEALALDSPGHMERGQWHAQLRRRMVEEGTIEDHGASLRPDVPGCHDS